MNKVLLGLALFTISCGKGEDTGAAPAACAQDVDGAYPTWGTFGESFFLSYCRSCHSAETPQRFGAPDAINFDSEEEVMSQLAAVRRTVLTDQSMPKGGGVPEAERAELARYLDCLESPP